MKITTSILCFALVVSAGCLSVDLDNPAQAVSQAEVVGNLTVFTYFVSNKADIKNAAKYLAVIELIEQKTQDTVPDSNFMSLESVIAAQLEQKLTGDDVVFLSGAKTLARILLLKLDQDVAIPKVEPSEQTKLIIDVVKAFLRGAKASLQDFITN